jgi:SAM-dependent methyltransferase
MTGLDLEYITRLISLKKIGGPVLELGAGYGGYTCREMIEESGLVYYATDMKATQYVDFAADFESDDVEKYFENSIKFKSILILNVLEHTFNPALILDNALKLLETDGSLIIIAPCSWALHNYPMDCYRFMPNFFEQYAARRRMKIDSDSFEYLGHGQIAAYQDETGNYCLPLPGQGGNYWKSRLIHRIFDTFGRGMMTPSTLAIGVVMNRADTKMLQATDTCS